MYKLLFLVVDYMFNRTTLQLSLLQLYKAAVYCAKSFNKEYPLLNYIL